MLYSAKFFKSYDVIDSHSHIFPPAIFDKIWEYFEENYWHVKYKLYADQIAEFFTFHNISHFTTLNYAHRPNISSMMNQFIFDFHKKYPQSIPLGTVHPGDKDLINVAEEALTTLDLKGFKLQLLVTDFYIHDNRLKPVFDLLKREDKILVVHAGTGPLENDYVGIKYFRKFLESYPDLKIQIAHLGCFEYREFFALLDEYPRLMMDDAMILVDHDLFPSQYDLGYEILQEYEDRLMFGSDFPNIPYNYEESYKLLFQQYLPNSFYDKFFFENAKKFYSL